MNRDDIIRMAREAGFEQAGHLSHQGFTAIIERFATLVAAVEREACAKVCDKFNFGQAPKMIQDAIRARGRA